jgi:hypothetical protein
VFHHEGPVPVPVTATRRQVLGAAGVVVAAVALGGCSSAGSAGAGGRDAQELTDLQALQDALSDAQSLLSGYRATAAAQPATKAALAPFTADVEAHVSALTPLLAAAGSASASTSAGSTSGTPTKGAAATPATPIGVAALVAAERATAGRRATDCETVSPGVASLIGSLSACASSHAALLGRVAR